MQNISWLVLLISVAVLLCMSVYGFHNGLLQEILLVLLLVAALGMGSGLRLLLARTGERAMDAAADMLYQASIQDALYYRILQAYISVECTVRPYVAVVVGAILFLLLGGIVLKMGKLATTAVLHGPIAIINKALGAVLGFMMGEFLLYVLGGMIEHWTNAISRTILFWQLSSYPLMGQLTKLNPLIPLAEYLKL